MAKLTPPNVSLFGSGPIETALAPRAATSDPSAGLAAAWMMIAGNDRKIDQDKYLGALGSTNQLDAALQRYEMEQKLREEGMKQAAGLAKEGYMPSQLKGSKDLFHDPTQGDEMAGLMQALIRAKIGAQNRSGGSGGGSKATTEVTNTVMPWGAQGPTVIKSKNADPGAAHSANATALAQTVAAMKANPGAYTADQKKQVTQQLMMLSNQSQPGIVD